MSTRLGGVGNGGALFGLHLGKTSGQGRRTLFTSAFSSFKAEKRNGGERFTRASNTASFARAAAFPSFAILAVGYYSTKTTIGHADGTMARSASSVVLRGAGSSTYRNPQTKLIFMSYDQEHKPEWQGWIGYFRQAGYDCFDLNLALDGEDQVESLSEELGGQVRLLSLSRPPLLFAYSGHGSRVALHHIQSRQPRIGGLVLVNPKGTEQSTLEQADELDKDKLCILTLDGEEDQEAMLKTERWMDRQGFS